MKNNQQKGFISTIILIIVAIVILKYVFGISPKDIIQSKLATDLWNVIKELFRLLWEAVLITLDFLKLAIEKMKDFVGSLNTK